MQLIFSERGKLALSEALAVLPLVVPGGSGPDPLRLAGVLRSSWRSNQITLDSATFGEFGQALANSLSPLNVRRSCDESVLVRRIFARGFKITNPASTSDLNWKEGELEWRTLTIQGPLPPAPVYGSAPSLQRVLDRCEELEFPDFAHNLENPRSTGMMGVVIHEIRLAMSPDKSNQLVSDLSAALRNIRGMPKFNLR